MLGPSLFLQKFFFCPHWGSNQRQPSIKVVAAIQQPTNLINDFGYLISLEVVILRKAFG